MNAVFYHEADLILRLVIQPKSSRDQFIGIYNQELKLAITAPPIDGKANAHLIKYLAKAFRVAKSNIVLEKGELSRHKQVRVIAPKQLPEEIKSLLSNQ